MIIGADECGYGCWAGPVYVCAVKAPPDWTLPGLNDSKALSPKKRLILRDKLILDTNISYHIAQRSAPEIDNLNIAVALKQCYIECFITLDTNKNCEIIVDGILKFKDLGVDDYNIKSLIKADTLIPAVMAASIIGKVCRDEYMKKLHQQYPMYDWANNAGYGVKSHVQGLQTHGVSPHHRKSYKPIKKLL